MWAVWAVAATCAWESSLRAAGRSWRRSSRPALTVTVVVTDRECRALEVAGADGVPAELVLRESYGPGFDRGAYTRRLVDVLERYEVDVVAMAGFGTIFSAEMFAAFPGRVLNTHPALLPAFKGWHAVRDALAAGRTGHRHDRPRGHRAVDEGPVLAQEEVPVLPGDTEETLHERIKAVERRLYPETIHVFMTQLRKSGTAQGGSE